MPLESSVGLAWSCDQARFIDTEYYGGLKFIFENRSNDWLEVEISRIELDPVSQKVKVLSPTELSEFWQSYKLRYDDLLANAEWGKVIVGSAIRGAAAGAAGSSSSEGGGWRAAQIAAIAGSASTTADSGAKIDAYPDAHLLGPKFKIAPGLYVERSIVLEVRDVRDVGRLKLCFTSGSKQCVIYDLTAVQNRFDSIALTCAQNKPYSPDKS